MPVEQSTTYGEEVVYDRFYDSDWQDIVDSLGAEPGSVGVLAVDNGRVDDTLMRRGDFVRGRFDEFNVEGLVVNGDLLRGPEVIPREERDRGYYLSNSMGSEAELKFVEELGPYPEDLHWHNADEHYVSDGEFQMVVASQNFPTSFSDYMEAVSGYDLSMDFVIDNPEYFDHVTISNTQGNPVLKVDSRVPHAIVAMEEGSSLGVFRVPETNEYIGKWDWQGDQVYNHLDDDPEFPGIATYTGLD